MLPRLVLLAVALCLLTGCGGDDEKQVKSAVKELYAGFAERDAGKVCDSLTRAQQQAVAKGGAASKVQGRSCEQVMGFALGFVGNALKDAKQAEVTDVRLDGDKARATVEFKGRSGNLGVAKEGGEWKVSDFDLDRL